MLRAIGAQIEKTTNREACRDLSGRRLRDINEEKRIKEWITKEKQRKEEMEERRRQKLERMAQQPKTQFNDIEFERTRSEIPDIVDEALQYGLQVAQSSSGHSEPQKRKVDPNESKKANKKKKVALWIAEDVDIEDDSNSSADDNEDISTKNTNENSNLSLTSNDNSNESEVVECGEKEAPESCEKSNESDPSNNDNKSQELEDSKEPKQESENILSSESVEANIEQTQDSGALNKDKNANNSNDDQSQVWEPLNLMEFESVQQLESLGLDKLKHSLMALGMKCGGTLTERATRLWSVRGLDVKDIPKKLLAKKKWWYTYRSSI